MADGLAQRRGGRGTDHRDGRPLAGGSPGRLVDRGGRGYRPRQPAPS